jgi:hypothetical protein
MTKKEFIRKISRGKKDILGDFINTLRKKKIKFCIIGGLAVNAYAEPVVSLDMDVVVVAEKIGCLISELESRYKVERFINSVNISSIYSDLRIQLQTDPRYQDFIKRATIRQVLGYRLMVAAVRDVLKGKIWAAQDVSRRRSKRQKDLADIARLVENRPKLAKLIPEDLKEKLDL